MQKRQHPPQACRRVLSVAPTASRKQTGLLTQNQLQNYASADGNQHVVAAVLDPLITAWRRFQMMAAPVVDDVLTVTVFRRQTVATVKCLIGASAATIAVIVMTLLALLRSTAVAATVIAVITLIVLIVLVRTAVLRVYGRQGAACQGGGE
jgi:hypothetical protein